MGVNCDISNDRQGLIDIGCGWGGLVIHAVER